MSKDENDQGDIMHIGPFDGRTAPYVRFTSDGPELGLIESVTHSTSVPEGASLVSVHHEGDGVYRARTIHKGPVRTTSPNYRKGWESIFGARQEVGQA